MFNLLGKSTGRHLSATRVLLHEIYPQPSSAGWSVTFCITCGVALMICSREWTTPKSWGRMEECHVWEETLQSLKFCIKYGDIQGSCIWWYFRKPINIVFSIHCHQLRFILCFPCAGRFKGKKVVWWGHNIDLDWMRFNRVDVYVLVRGGRVMVATWLQWLSWLVDHLYLILTFWGFKIQILGLQDLWVRISGEWLRILDTLSPPSFSLCTRMYLDCWQKVSRRGFLDVGGGNWAWY